MPVLVSVMQNVAFFQLVTDSISRHSSYSLPILTALIDIIYHGNNAKIIKEFHYKAIKKRLLFVVFRRLDTLPSYQVFNSIDFL